MIEVKNSVRFSHALNKAYMNHCPGWPTVDNTRQFYTYAREHYGIDVEFKPAINEKNSFCYKVNGITVIDERKYTLFLLKWA